MSESWLVSEGGEGWRALWVNRVENTPPRSLMSLSSLPWSTEQWGEQMGGSGSEHGCVWWRWDEQGDKHCLLLSGYEENVASHTGVSTGRSWWVRFRSVASANAKHKDSLSVPLILTCIWLTRSASLLQTSPVLPHTWPGCFAPWVLSLAGPKPCSGETGCVSPQKGTSSVNDSSGSHSSKAVMTTKLQLGQVWHISPGSGCFGSAQKLMLGRKILIYQTLKSIKKNEISSPFLVFRLRLNNDTEILDLLTVTGYNRYSKWKILMFRWVKMGIFFINLGTGLRKAVPFWHIIVWAHFHLWKNILIMILKGILIGL